MSKEILNVETNEVKPSTTRGWIAYILNKLKGVNGPEINKRINSLDNSISNPNELLNSNFNLWSFGNSMTYTETHAKKYCADRWFIQSDGNLIYAKKKITDGKTTIEVDASSQKLYTNLMQDFSGEWYNNNKGKTVTITVKFAAKVKDIKVGIVLYPNLFTDSKLATEYTDIISYTTKVPDMDNNTYGGFYIQTDKPMVFEVEYVKVELSEKATQYIPPINSDELLRCSMYENEIIRQPYSNPNLTLNGDFQVWQRGTSFSFNATGTALGYTADRFIVHAEGTQAITVTKGDEGLYMNFTNGNNGTSNLTTYFPYDEVKKWKGKIMTTTVEYKSDSDKWEPYAFIFVNPTDAVVTKLLKIDKIDLGSGWKRLVTTFKVEDVKDTMIHFQIQWLRSQSIGSLQGLTKVRSVKLEYGQYSTPFTSRTYSEELRECKHYYERWYSKKRIGLGIIYATNKISLDVDYDTKRSLPAIRLTNTADVVVGTTVTPITAFNVIETKHSNAIINVDATTGSATAGTVVAVNRHDYTDGNATIIEFDSEIKW